jgi:hypothetical protein
MQCFVTHPFLSRSNSRKVCLKSSMDNGSDEGPPGCCGAPYMVLREGLSADASRARESVFLASPIAGRTPGAHDPREPGT